MSVKEITVPFEMGIVTTLKAGDMVHLSGTIFTARDAAHKRLIDTLKRGQPLPVSLENQIIYYVGPAPAKEGHVIGPAGPTTSGRVDPYTIPLLELGVKGLIGKGYRSPEIKQALVEHQAVYMAAVGGAAALLAKQITDSRVIAYDDLGTELIRLLTIKDFPAIVINDCQGGDTYEAGRRKYRT